MSDYSTVCHLCGHNGGGFSRGEYGRGFGMRQGQGVRVMTGM